MKNIVNDFIPETKSLIARYVGPTAKLFKVAAVSRRPNPFGLYGHVLVAKDGEAWEVGRTIGSGNEPWPQGAELNLPIDQKGNQLFPGCEIPRRITDAPAALLNELFPRI